MRKFAVYIIRTADRFLYTGIASNLTRRLKEHNAGIRSFIKNRKKPFRIVYKEYFITREEAARREREIKGWSRKKKENLIKLVKVHSEEF